MVTVSAMMNCCIANNQNEKAMLLYEEYNKIIPLKTGYEKRSIIYNFYHVLNHANIFGVNSNRKTKTG